MPHFAETRAQFAMTIMEKDILLKLIAIPSYVDDTCSEKGIGDYIFKLLNDNCPWLTVKRQLVSNNRFNIIAEDFGKKKDLVFISHIDTVLPSGSKEKMLKPEIKDGMIYGLGAADMKGGIAALLSAIIKAGPTKGCVYIFDCDEEYYFLGIQKVIKEYEYNPRLVIFPEPTDLQIVNGCRGIVELSFDVIGKTAHAGVPENGINAIEKAVKIVEGLRLVLSNSAKTPLGKTTVNLSKLDGGRLLDGRIATQANAVPDVARILLDIRVADIKLSAQKIIKILQKESKKEKVQITNIKINLDYPGYLTKKEEVEEFYSLVMKIDSRVQFKEDIGKGGFFEAAFVCKAWNCPAISFGPGLRETSHTTNEQASIEMLNKTKEVYCTLLKKYATILVQ